MSRNTILIRTLRIELAECYLKYKYLKRHHDLNLNAFTTTEIQFQHCTIKKRTQLLSLKSDLLDALFADGYHLDQLFIEDDPPSSDEIPFGKRVEIIVYDYDAIKKHRSALHSDLAYVYRFFGRLLRIRYDTPIAVAVSQK